MRRVLEHSRKLRAAKSLGLAERTSCLCNKVIWLLVG